MGKETIITKSDEEILNASYDELTDEEYEHQQYLRDLLESGFYEPLQTDTNDIASLMKEKNIIPEEDANRHYMPRKLKIDLKKERVNGILCVILRRLSGIH